MISQFEVNEVLARWREAHRSRYPAFMQWPDGEEQESGASFAPAEEVQAVLAFLNANDLPMNEEPGKCLAYVSEIREACLLWLAKQEHIATKQVSQGAMIAALLYRGYRLRGNTYPQANIDGYKVLRLQRRLQGDEFRDRRFQDVRIFRRIKGSDEKERARVEVSYPKEFLQRHRLH